MHGLESVQSILSMHFEPLPHLLISAGEEDPEVDPHAPVVVFVGVLLEDDPQRHLVPHLEALRYGKERLLPMGGLLVGCSAQPYAWAHLKLEPPHYPCKHGVGLDFEINQCFKAIEISSERPQVKILDYSGCCNDPFLAN